MHSNISKSKTGNSFRNKTKKNLKMCKVYILREMSMTLSAHLITALRYSVDQKFSKIELNNSKYLSFIKMI